MLSQHLEDKEESKQEGQVASSSTPPKFQLKDTLLSQYIKPFIDAIPENFSAQEQKYLLSNAVSYAARQATKITQYERFPAHNQHPALEPDIEYLGKYNGSFIEDIKLIAAYKKLFAMYCDKEIQINTFPLCQYSIGQIQTCIRELFHDVINPVKELSKDSIQAVQKKMCVSNNILNLPLEIATMVHSLLDYKTCKALTLVSRSTYFFCKNLINTPENILYVLGTDVPISRPRRMLEGDLDVSCLLLPELEKQAIIASAPDRNLKVTKIFSSLYQAIEYAHSLQHGGDPCDGQEVCHIPSVWAVRYYGNVNYLKFVSKHLILNQGYSSSQYASSERNTTISYAHVEINSFLPIVGTVAYSGNSFASYKRFRTVSFDAELFDGKGKKNNNGGCVIS